MQLGQAAGSRCEADTVDENFENILKFVLVIIFQIYHEPEEYEVLKEWEWGRALELPY